MLQVMLYSKAGCHLCDEARGHLEDVAAAYDDMVIDEVDIRRDADSSSAIGYRIPVIVVDGVERLEGRIEAADIQALFPA